MTDNNAFFTSARNAQIVIYLLKAHNIRKVIASPGTQNMSLVTSMQRDSFFEMYSAPDERSAAYMACGLSAESGEPVVLSCTGATASRNYVPGLTEAFYRHLPVIAITSTERINKVGQNIPQIIDRSILQCDIAKISVRANAVDTDDDEWLCMLEVNKALLEIYHHGSGPVHINLEKVNDYKFSVEKIPPCRVINRYTAESKRMPSLPQGRIAIFVGAHQRFDKELTSKIENFCSQHGAVVFCDKTSNYHGAHAVNFSLVASQDRYVSQLLMTDLLIWLGEISGDYYQQGKLGTNTKEVWRVNGDGILRDQFKKLTNIFEMEENAFFAYYTSQSEIKNDDSLRQCQEEWKKCYDKIPQLPFSNIWMAKEMSPMIPHDSVMHFGILNSLRAWNFFLLDDSIDTSCNVGGFGIDGGLSTLLGSSLATKDRLHFGIFGDLAFFYDMNSLGNRHVGNNLRIMLVNNAKGSEFKLYSHPASKLGSEADEYIAAARHYGNKSPQLVKHYSEDLGFQYLSASCKVEFLEVYPKFLVKHSDRPILFEVFTNSEDENKALFSINNILVSKEAQIKDKIKALVGESNIHAISKVVGLIKR